jgi:diamine N-acetyltransferase
VVKDNWKDVYETHWCKDVNNKVFKTLLLLSMSIEIRKVLADEVEQLAAISANTFYEAFAKDNTAENMQKHLKEYYSIEKLSAELNDPLAVFLFAVSDYEVVGYVKINEHQKPEAKDLDTPIELERIYSLQSMIGKGVGKALMQAVINTAVEKEKKTIWLGVWQHNPTAIAFYKKWGFEIFGDHVFAVGDDPQMDWLMKKVL